MFNKEYGCILAMMILACLFIAMVLAPCFRHGQIKIKVGNTIYFTVDANREDILGVQGPPEQDVYKTVENYFGIRFNYEYMSYDGGNATITLEDGHIVGFVDNKNVLHIRK